MIKLTTRIWILIIALLLAALMISPSFQTGAVIKSVEKDSNAYNQGLRQGMILKEVNAQKIESQEDYVLAVSNLFVSNNESRVDIKTDKQEFIFLANNLSEIVVGPIPKTKLKTGLDLSGGARAVIKPENVSISEEQLSDLIAITNERLNAFGISDVTVRAAKDLSGENYMVVEIAGATPSDVKSLLGSQGKFEAKVANQTVFEGGERDISDVCRNDGKCASITGCFPSQEGGYFCSFAFAVYLKEDAAKKHAELTKNLSLDSTGKYLSEKLYLYVDDIEVDSLLISSNLRGQTQTQIQIQGSGAGQTQEEAVKEATKQMNRLQTILLTGSLPYKLEIVKLDTISPFLGKEFTKNIIYLGLVVFLVISLSLFIKYRKIKITLAVILTMFSEMFITLGIAALIKWNLDASSIAGIIAGMGTGVNDQIVIIDESVSGKEGRETLKEKVKRAFFIIVGAFLTIIAAMIPLFWAGAGLLRGFALTTIIGVSIGILITRPAFADIIKRIEE
ncbi:MMPL family transporter [Candidatus Pacearchaeota archaeon]|nr:MMPL family transporter [Candidatus Pacearchaeota archaeon]